MKVVKNKKKVIKDSTNLSIQVESTAQEEIFEYDKERIVRACMNEIGCTEEMAQKIADTVTEKLVAAKMETVTSSLIRSFVNVVLSEQGYNKQLQSNSEIVLHTNDIESYIFNKDKNNGNTPHNPESINLSIAENVIKQYALKRIVPEKIAEKHLRGDLHIHDLGMINRLYCSGHNPEYIKRYGIKNMKNMPTESSPAGSAWTAVRHIASSTMFFTSLFAGAIGWDAINMFLAPYTLDWNEKKYMQLAQTLLYDFSQLAGAKGGQVSFTDFNVYAVTPKFYEDTWAVGKSGCYMFRDTDNTITYIYDRAEMQEYSDSHDGKILTYKDFEAQTQDLCMAILKVSEQGDLRGMPFGFPKIHFHINAAVFTNQRAKELFDYTCRVLSKTGNPYIDFDRSAASMSQCCRLVLKFDNKDMELTKTPEELRFCGGQNVSINLANIPLSARTEEEFYKELSLRMDMCAEMHQVKLDYIKSIAQIDNSPLAFYESGSDYKPYVKYDRISWLIGIVGLNECVKNITGKELHESKTAYLKGLEIITFMKNYSNQLSQEYGMNMKLEETPAESTAGRFAKLDKKHYQDAFMKGDGNGVYYTNSIHFPVDANIDYIDKLIYQSKFHPLVEAGSMIHMWVGEKSPSPESISKLIKDVYEKTSCTELTISPNQTVCNHCNTTTNGFFETCPNCNSNEIFWIARITGYSVPVHMFNESKLAELKDRVTHDIGSPMISMNFLTDDICEEDGVILYTKPNCPNCKRLKTFLNETDISFTNYDVTTDIKAQARMILEGKELLPVVQIGKEFMEFSINKFETMKEWILSYAN